MPEKCKERIIQLTKWNNYYENPTLGTMKYLALRRKETGFDKCTTMINGRLYIFIEKFFAWLESKDGNEEKSSSKESNGKVVIQKKGKQHAL